MNEVVDLVKGPFKDEAAFKAAVLKAWRRKSAEGKNVVVAGVTFFEIESEETEPGFPDVICVHPKKPAWFIEFKLSDSSGIITFQKTQPLFYKKHKDIDVVILAWDAQRNRMMAMGSHEVIKLKTLTFKIPEELLSFVDSLLARAREEMKAEKKEEARRKKNDS